MQWCGGGDSQSATRSCHLLHSEPSSLTDPFTSHPTMQGCGQPKAKCYMDLQVKYFMLLNTDNLILIFSDTKIDFAHEVLSDGDLLIEDLKFENSGNFTCSIINMHGQDSITHSLTVHGEF